MFAYINEQTHEVLRRSQLKENDILFSIAGVLGRVGMVVKEVLPANTNQALAIIRPSIDGEVDIKFLFYCLQAEYIVRAINQLQIGVAQANLSLENVKELWLSLPPLPEQQRIAESLGEVDKLIESLDEQIEKKRLIAKGVAHDLLSGKKRLPGFKGEWRCANLGTLVDFITDTIATKDIDTRKYVSTDNMLSNLAGVTPNKSIMPYASVREFKSGDILLSNIRPYLKKMWFADYDAGCSTDVLVLRVVADVIDSRFLYRVLARDIFFEFVSAKAVGTKMPRGDKRVIAVFQVPIPQLAEQQTIADLLSEQDAAIAALEAKREKYVRIKEGMMRDLLTGKVRMKGELTKKEACA
jgi:restriction endonuclease S subunit